jgi:hypothetical protein
MTPDPNRLYDEWAERRQPLETGRRQALWTLVESGSPEAAAQLLNSLHGLDALNARPGFLEEVLDGLLDCLDDPELELRLQRLLAQSTAAQDPPRSLNSERQLEVGLLDQAWNWRSSHGEDQGASLPDLERRALVTPETRVAEALWRRSRQAGFPRVAGLVRLESLRRERARALGYGDFRALQLGLVAVPVEAFDTQCQHLERLSRASWQQGLATLAASLAEPGANPATLASWDLGDSLCGTWLSTRCLPGPPPCGVRQCLDLGRELLDSLGLPTELLAGVGPLPGAHGFAPEDLCDTDGEGRVRLWLPGPGLELPRFLALLGQGLCLALGEDVHPGDLRVQACGRLLARLAGRGPGLAPWLPAGVAAGVRDTGPLLSLYTLRRLLRDLAFEQQFRAEPDQDLDALWARLDRDLLWYGHHRTQPPGAWAAQPWLAAGTRAPALELLAELASRQLEEALLRELGLEPGALWITAGPEAGGWLADRLIQPLAELDPLAHIEELTGQALDTGALCRALALTPDTPDEADTPDTPNNPTE